jgi:hypothetical protein
MELTPLESRLVPSTWWVTNNLDSGYGPDVPGSLRWANDHAQNGDIIRFAQNMRGDSIQLTGPNLTIAHNEPSPYWGGRASPKGSIPTFL